MRLSLLRMTQLILSAMDSDEVSSIGDTTESIQVVDAIETSYYDLCATIDFPDQWDFFELDPSNDPDRPTLLSLPENVAKLEWIQYDRSEDGSTKREMTPIYPLERQEFLNRMNSLDTEDDRVFQYDLMIDGKAIDIRGHNDQSPTYYTTNNDRTILFDSFDQNVAQTVVSDRTLCYGMLIPQFIREDDFIPDLQPRHFTLLFNEAKSQAFADLKSVTNTRAETKARKGWVQAHRKSPQTGAAGRIWWDYTYDFGRGSGGRGTSGIPGPKRSRKW